MPGGVKDAEIVAETTGSSSLERSKTERRRQNNQANDPAKQLLDDTSSPTLNASRVKIAPYPYII